MALLCLDTTTQIARVGVFDCAEEAPKTLAVRETTEGVRQSQILLPTISGTLVEAGLGLADLSGLAVLTGPGSFTGLRIGLSVAHGLQLSKGLKTLSVGGFDLMRWALAHQSGFDHLKGASVTLVLPLNAKAVFVQALGADHERAGDPVTVAIEALPDVFKESGVNTVVCDDKGASEILSNLSLETIFLGRKLEAMAQWAMAQGVMAQPASVVGDAFPEPVYIKSPDVTLKSA